MAQHRCRTHLGVRPAATAATRPIRLLRGTCHGIGTGLVGVTLWRIQQHS
ncbi:hypothetical protein ABT112_31605 [Streptomyces sp. NPDC002055]